MRSRRHHVLILCIAMAAMAGCGKSSPDAAAPSGRSVMGALEAQTNRPGRDLSIGGVRSASAEECSNRCAAEAQCQAMSFSSSSESSGEGFCFLKSGVSEPASSPSVVSAVKLATP